MNNTMVLLLENHFNQIYNIAKSYARKKNHPSPEDAASDAISAALRNSQKFEGDLSNLISYILAITHYDVIDYHKSPTGKLYTIPVDDLYTHPSYCDEYFVYQYLLNIKNITSTLTSSEAKSIISTYVYDHNNFQTADFLNVSYTNARVIKSRALSKLRKTLVPTK